MKLLKTLIIWGIDWAAQDHLRGIRISSSQIWGIRQTKRALNQMRKASSMWLLVGRLIFSSWKFRLSNSKWRSPKRIDGSMNTNNRQMDSIRCSRRWIRNLPIKNQYCVRPTRNWREIRRNTNLQIAILTRRTRSFKERMRNYRLRLISLMVTMRISLMKLRNWRMRIIRLLKPWKYTRSNSWIEKEVSRSLLRCKLRWPLLVVLVWLISKLLGNLNIWRNRLSKCRNRWRRKSKRLSFLMRERSKEWTLRVHISPD